MGCHQADAAEQAVAFLGERPSCPQWVLPGLGLRSTICPRRSVRTPRATTALFGGGGLVPLQLSGHTHGGLIRGIDRLAARANAGNVSGRYHVDGMTLYVNNDTALWPGFALRLGRPSELTRITLRQATLQDPP